MKYTHPGLIYAVNYISSYDSFPSTPVLQVIKHISRYLDRCPHYPIMYASILNGTATYKLRKEFSPSDFHYHKISINTITFEDGREVCAINDKRAIN